MDKRSAQIATICECIDQCFAFAIWCEDFVQHLDPDDLAFGLDRGCDLVSDATRLQSFLAFRKLDDFFGGVRPQPEDLVATDFKIDVRGVLDDIGETFLSVKEREDINKGVAHLTERLSLDRDTELDLQAIVKRSIPVLSRLISALRKADAAKEAASWLDSTEALVKRADAL